MAYIVSMERETHLSKFTTEKIHSRPLLSNIILCKNNIFKNRIATDWWKMTEISCHFQYRIRSVWLSKVCGSKY